MVSPCHRMIDLQPWWATTAIMAVNQLVAIFYVHKITIRKIFNVGISVGVRYVIISLLIKKIKVIINLSFIGSNLTCWYLLFADIKGAGCYSCWCFGICIPNTSILFVLLLDKTWTSLWDFKINIKSLEYFFSQIMDIFMWV